MVGWESGPAWPAPTGSVVRASNVAELFEAAERIPAGGTIALADGRYSLDRCLWLRRDAVTLRGESGDPTRVVLDGAACREGELVALQSCRGVALVDLTLQNVRYNAIKLNTDSGVHAVTIHRCILSNIWQRAVKGVKVPAADRDRLRPRDGRIQHCVFENARPKAWEDDPTDTAETFGGNYIGGIDLMYPRGWRIAHNVFRGIRGRSGAGRGAVFLWHEAEDCLVEDNLIMDCDTGIALGNSHKPEAVPIHASRCEVRDNRVCRTPEGGIVADYTRDCRIVHNTVHDPQSRLGRLIRVVHDSEGLLVADNVIDGAPPRNEWGGSVVWRGNRVGRWTDAFVDAAAGDLRFKAALSSTGRGAVGAATPTPTPPARWRYGPPWIAPERRDREPSRAQKDPTVVFYAGQWHVFMTVKLPGRSAIEYCAFERWEDADAAPRFLLSLSDSDYFCAPQIFYYRPHRLWYLVYQVGIPGQDRMWVAYSTSPDLADPRAWTRARPMLDGGSGDPRPVGGLDYWIICDATRAYLFFTSLDGRMWRCWTSRDAFPRGFAHCEVALKAEVFEASHTYRLRGSDRYLTLIEQDGRRHYKAYLADRLDGPWTPLADTESRPFAGAANVSPGHGVEPWTDNVSHGELVRAGYDETLVVDPAFWRFVFQGMREKDKAGVGYGGFSWRIGLLTPDDDPVEGSPAEP